MIDKTQIRVLLIPGIRKLKADLNAIETRWLEMGYDKEEFEELVEDVFRQDERRKFVENP